MRASILSRGYKWGRVPLLMLTLALAGCGAAPVRQADVPNFGEVKALFVQGEDVHVINVRALDRLPITGAVLILPGGARVEAYSIDQHANPSFSSHAALGGQGADVTSIGAGAPLLTGSGTTQVKTTLIGQTASTALIRVPEPAVYKEVWSQSKVEIHMGFAPDSRVEILAAPQPG